MEGPYEFDVLRFLIIELLISSLFATLIIGLPIALVGAELLRWRDKLNLRTALLLANGVAAIFTLVLLVGRALYSTVLVPPIWAVANCLAMGGWFWVYKHIVRSTRTGLVNES